MLNPREIEQYLMLGGSLIVDVMSPDNCLKLARAARSGGGHITFVGSLTLEHMTEIHREAGGHVTFNLAAFATRVW